MWKFITESELAGEIQRFRARKQGLDKAIAAMEAKVHAHESDASALRVHLKELESKASSVTHAVDGINRLLQSVGFSGFSLALAPDQRSYRLLRPDGSDARDTLSEGEKTFIVFLYFLHLVRGSQSESGMTVDRVVVIDDPVSSLDSSILFVVSTLIRHLMAEIRDDSTNLRQLFLLTHNVYFHKEVTYNYQRRGKALSEETFWVVRRTDNGSVLVSHEGNPIKTSYELLWHEVRSPERSRLTLQNTMRRILENYFKILGNLNMDAIVSKFEGEERLLCSSLVSWVNDGSHSAHDDLYVTLDEGSVQRYLKVFKAIFEKCGHDEHYRMMMGEVR